MRRWHRDRQTVVHYRIKVNNYLIRSFIQSPVSYYDMCREYISKRYALCTCISSSSAQVVNRYGSPDLHSRTSYLIAAAWSKRHIFLSWSLCYKQFFYLCKYFIKKIFHEISKKFLISRGKIFYYKL